MGISMGSPLGSLISEVLMEKFEHEIFHPNHYFLPPYCFPARQRYTDDVFRVLTDSTKIFEDFLSFINKLLPYYQVYDRQWQEISIEGGKLVSQSKKVFSNVYTEIIFRSRVSPVDRLSLRSSGGKY